VAIKTEKRTEKEKKPNAIKRWWRETVGEMRKVSWPTLPDARRLTKIVLIVMAIMALLLGVLDYLFSALITLILT
jgi:preprotein translocase subunit SecE